MRSGMRWTLAPAMIGAIAVFGAACSDESPGAASAASESSTSTSATSTTAGAPTESTGTADCAVPNVPIVELEPQAGAEPVIGIPVPAGWVRETSMDSAMLRGAFASAGLVRDSFAPNVTVAVEDLTSKVPTAQAGVRAELDSIKSIGGTIVSQRDLTVCGHPAGLAQVRLPAMGDVPERDGSLLAVVSETGGKMTATVLTLQTTDGANPAYLADAQTFIDGVQITPQGSRH